MVQQVRKQNTQQQITIYDCHNWYIGYVREKKDTPNAWLGSLGGPPSMWANFARQYHHSFGNAKWHSIYWGTLTSSNMLFMPYMNTYFTLGWNYNWDLWCHFQTTVNTEQCFSVIYPLYLLTIMIHSTPVCLREIKELLQFQFSSNW